MKRTFLFCLLIIPLSCVEKEVHTFQVQEDDGFLVSQPVFLDTSQVLDKNIAQFSLFQTKDPISFQSDDEHLWFVHNPEGGPSYRLEKTAKTKTRDDDKLKVLQRNGNLEIVLNDRSLIHYRYEMTYPPQGVDSIFKKSGYIHPLITPKGDTLTAIQPADHYHHYGLWGPWTHTQIDGERVDFWNLGDGMGTVLFKEFKDSVSGPVFASFTAVQEHMDLKTKNRPQIALNEDLRIRMWNLNHPDRYMFDYTTTFNSPLENGILFEAYRYGGGLGLRFNERWKRDNCEVLTSEGKSRLEADGTSAKWCIVKGESSDGKGTCGILFLSHPNNRMHPEPMRVWPIDANDGRGDLFFEFCPIRHKEWKIVPDREYSLNYRLVVFDGELTAEEAEAYWQGFANNPKLKKISN